MLKTKELLFIITLYMASPIILFSQDCADKVTAKSVEQPDTTMPNRLYREAVEHLGNDLVLRHGQVGIVVLDVKTGEILAAQNPKVSLIPASNMKIVSTAAGLSILGNDFQFRTELQYDGNIRDSVLYGNIIIKGYGDPTLGSPLMPNVPSMRLVLDSFTSEIRRLGIKSIVGKIVGDGTAFENGTAVPTWLWEDLGNAYGAGPSGLNFHENLYELTFQQNQSVGTHPSVLNVAPYIPDFQHINEVKSIVGGGDNAYIYAVPNSTSGFVRGTIPTGNGAFSIKGSIPDPPFFAAWHLRRTLIERNIAVSDSATTQMVLEQEGKPMFYRTTFFTWLSPKLPDIVNMANHESVNLYCEAILRAVGLKQSGVGTNEEGVKSIVRFWQTKGIDTEGLFMQDGSGLSPRNGITPLQLASMLRSIAIDSQVFTPFYASLPEAGTSGTLKNMFKETPSVKGRLRAKSGTITRVKSYSGYVTTGDGRLLAFSAICNNFTCSQRDIRKKLEQFMVEICGF